MDDQGLVYPVPEIARGVQFVRQFPGTCLLVSLSISDIQILPGTTTQYLCQKFPSKGFHPVDLISCVCKKMKEITTQVEEYKDGYCWDQESGDETRRRGEQQGCVLSWFWFLTPVRSDSCKPIGSPTLTDRFREEEQDFQGVSGLLTKGFWQPKQHVERISKKNGIVSHWGVVHPCLLQQPSQVLTWASWQEHKAWNWKKKLVGFSLLFWDRIKTESLIYFTSFPLSLQDVQQSGQQRHYKRKIQTKISSSRSSEHCP